MIDPNIPSPGWPLQSRNTSAGRETLLNGLQSAGADITSASDGFGPAVTFGTLRVSGIEFSYAASMKHVAVFASQDGGPSGQGPAGQDAVVVTGTRRSLMDNFSWSSMGYEEGITSEEEWNEFFDSIDAQLDRASVDVTVNFQPTPIQQRMIDRYKADINLISEQMKTLPDNALLNIPGRGVLTGAEFKEMWFRSDFIINPEGTLYQNGTRRGEANPNDGNPIVSLNIDTLFGYGNSQAGRIFLVMHEVAHTVTESVIHNERIHEDGILSSAEHHEHERLANDIARAVANQLGLPILSGTSPALDGPEHGYTDGFPSFLIVNPVVPDNTEISPPVPTGPQEPDTDPSDRAGAWNGRTWLP